MNILFTCAGRRTYLLKYFRENMQVGDKIVATDMQLSAPALQIADIKLHVPAVYSNDYIDITLGICKEYNIDVLISLNDLELPILANNKGRFEEIGVQVIVSDPKVIEIAFDKYKTYQWVASLGLKSPKTYLRLEDVNEAIEKGKISFPLILKPRWGSGSIGVEIVNDQEELVLAYKLLNRKIKNTILAVVSKSNNSILVQEMLLGDEFGLDVINDLNSNFVSVSVKRKLAMRAGETDKALTVDLPELRDIGVMIGSNLGHVGNLDVDIIQRSNGDYCILDFNPRFGGGFPFSYEAGVNLPKAIIEWVKGNQIDSKTLLPEYGRMYAKNDYLMEILDK